MEMSVIDYLYYDDDMRKIIEVDAEFERIEMLSDRIAEKLKAKLTEEQLKEFYKLEETVMEEYSVATKLYFRQGVKVGIRIVSESMFDLKNKPLKGLVFIFVDLQFGCGFFLQRFGRQTFHFSFNVVS